MPAQSLLRRVSACKCSAEIAQPWSAKKWRRRTVPNRRSSTQRRLFLIAGDEVMSASWWSIFLRPLYSPERVAQLQEIERGSCAVRVAMNRAGDVFAYRSSSIGQSVSATQVDLLRRSDQPAHRSEPFATNTLVDAGVEPAREVHRADQGSSWNR